MKIRRYSGPAADADGDNGAEYGAASEQAARGSAEVGAARGWLATGTSVRRAGQRGRGWRHWEQRQQHETKKMKLS
jgi:hypothetical protein